MAATSSVSRRKQVQADIESVLSQYLNDEQEISDRAKDPCGRSRSSAERARPDEEARR